MARASSILLLWKPTILTKPQQNFYPLTESKSIQLVACSISGISWETESLSPKAAEWIINARTVDTKYIRNGLGNFEAAGEISNFFLNCYSKGQEWKNIPP